MNFFLYFCVIAVNVVVIVDANVVFVAAVGVDFVVVAVVSVVGVDFVVVAVVCVVYTRQSSFLDFIP